MTKRTLLRAGGAAAVLAGVLAVTTTPVGEGDRSRQRAIAIVRAIQTAQSAYRDITGHYDTLECLAGRECESGARRILLAPVLARLEDRHGYRFQFHPSPGIETFAVTAVPLGAADTVRPSFCGDDTGALHVIGDGSTPRIEAGRCAQSSGR